MPTIARPNSNPAFDPANLAARLRRNDASFRARWTTLALLGFCVLWIGPLACAAILFASQKLEHGPITPFATSFLWCSAILIPILFLLEFLTRGAFLEDAVNSVDTGTLAGNYAMRRAGAGLVAIEVCLWGPRMIIAGIKRIAGAGRFTKDDREAAAKIVSALLRREDGMETAPLFTEAALPDATFGQALAYLTFHDQIGISKDGSRVWLLSEARKQLEK
jgi:hypothetical protein